MDASPPPRWEDVRSICMATSAYMTVIMTVEPVRAFLPDVGN